MSAFIEHVGLGACLACLGLPLLAASLGEVSTRDPRSRHWALLGPFVFALTLFAVPWLREAIRFRAEVMVPASSVLLGLVNGASVGREATSWSPLELIGAAYLSLVGLAALRHVVRSARLQRVLLSAESAQTWLQEEVESRARLLGVAAPMVLVSEVVAVPFVAGALWPSLVWPRQLLSTLTPEQRGLVIHHELSHLSREDHRLAPVLAGFQVAFPFHPTANRLMHELALAREEAVDQRIEPERLHAYAQLLVTVKAHACQKPTLEGLGMADASLRRRIEALTSSQRLPQAPVGRVAAFGIALLTGLVFAPRAIAEEPPEVIRATVGDVEQVVSTASPLSRVVRAPLVSGAMSDCASSMRSVTSAISTLVIFEMAIGSSDSV